MTFHDKDFSLKFQSRELEERLKKENRVYEVQEQKFINWGFEPEEYKEDIFEFRQNFGLEQFPPNESFLSFCNNELAFLILTQTNRVFRLRLEFGENDEGCVELDFPDGDRHIGQKLLNIGTEAGKLVGKGFINIGTKIFDGVQKNILRKRSTLKSSIQKKTDVARLENFSIFIQPFKGTNAIIASSMGFTYFINHFDQKIRRLNSLKGKVINHVIWFGKSKLKFGFEKTLIITNDNKFFSLSVDKRLDKDFSLDKDPNKFEYDEDLSKQLFSINFKLIIHQVQKVEIGDTVTLIFATDRGIQVLYGPKNWEDFFAKYKEPSFLQAALTKEQNITFSKQPHLMMDIGYFYDPNTIPTYPKSVIWSDGKTIVLYKNFSLNAQTITEKNFESPQNLKYAKKVDLDPKIAQVHEQILGIAVTEYNYYILTSDMITILSLLTQKVVQYYEIEEKITGQAKSLFHDQIGEIIWIICQNCVSKLDVSGEDKNSWETLVEEQNYKEALRIAEKYDSPYKKHIAGLYADYFFENQQFITASQYYNQSNRSFEEIFLQFAVHHDQRVLIALENYLIEIEKLQKLNHQEQTLHACKLELMIARLKNYQRLAKFENDEDIDLPEECKFEDKSQSLSQSQEIEQRPKRVSKEDLLNFKNMNINIFKKVEQPTQKQRSTIEKSNILLDKDCKNILYGQFEQINKNAKSKQVGALQKVIEMADLLQKKVQNMLEEFKDELNVEELVYDILRPYGFFNECFKFALLKENYESVITTYITMENYKNAIDIFNKLLDQEKLLELVIRFGFALIKHQCQQTFNLIKPLPKLDPSKMSLIINYTPKDQVIFTIEFLEHCVYNRKSKDQIVHNLLIYYLTIASQLYIEKLMKYLRFQEKQFRDQNKEVDFDLVFSLRIFRKLELLLPQIIIYGCWGFYERCVTLALKNNQINIAKEYAQKVTNDILRKQLWLQIALFMMEKGEQSLRDIVQLTQEEDGLTIEDILPNITGSIKLEYLKEELCRAIRDRNDKIQNIKGVVLGYQDSVQSLNNDFKILNQSYVTLEQGKKCQDCNKQIYTETYIVFECLHAFHKNCLYSAIKKINIKPEKIRQLDLISIQLKGTVEQNEDDGFFLSKPKQTKTDNSFNKKTKEELDDDFVRLLSEECPNCGYSIMESIEIVLDNDSKVAESWKI